jgi:hypothetical protein
MKNPQPASLLAFSLFAPIPFTLVTFAFLPSFPNLPIPPIIAELLPLGLLAVFTSVIIYHDTKRSLWRFL